MKLTDVVVRKAIIHELKSTDRKGAIKELAQAIKDAYGPPKFAVNDVVEAIMKRERMGSTGVGGGVAIPHAKIPEIKGGALGAFGRSVHGIDFNAVDGALVNLIFLIISPSEAPELHLRALQKTMWAIKRPNFCKFLKNAKSVKAIEEVFRDVEEGVAV